MEPYENVELEMLEVDGLVDLLDSLERLESNADFKKVIVNGYIIDKTLGAAARLAEPSVKKSGERPDLMEELVAVSNLQYYLKMIHLLGNGARDDYEAITGPQVGK